LVLRLKRCCYKPNAQEFDVNQAKAWICPDNGRCETTNVFLHPMLLVTRLKCVRGERPLFSDVNLSLAKGAWVHVKGDNGVGKTSLLRLLAGLSQPATGEIFWQGKNIQSDAQAYRRDLFFLGHQDALKDDLSPLENLEYASAIHGMVLNPAKAQAALHRSGLYGRAHLPVRTFSAGQKRRVMLARLAVSETKLWILDEPFTALDVGAAQILESLIAEHVSHGGAAIVTSHQAMHIPSGQVLQL
jgi:heme exporter protein A